LFSCKSICTEKNQQERLNNFWISREELFILKISPKLKTFVGCTAWYGKYIHLTYQETSTDQRYGVMLSLCLFNGAWHFCETCNKTFFGVKKLMSLQLQDWSSSYKAN